MKKWYIFLTVIFLAFLFVYTVHTKIEANHYANYINWKLNNFIKPSESDISQADKFIKDALKSKQISTDRLKGLVSLYGDVVANIQEIQSIEDYVTGTEQLGEFSKETLYSIGNNIRGMKSKGKTVKLTNDQMNILQEISDMNKDLLKVLKPTLQQEYKVNEDHWINVLKQMDNVTQNYYNDLFHSGVPY